MSVSIAKNVVFGHSTQVYLLEETNIGPE